VYALKAIRVDASKGPDQEASLRAERTILFKHTSEFLLRCYFSFSSAQHVFFALEYMAAGDLHQMLNDVGAFEESAACFYTAEVLMGMSYLHSKSVLHRDIKPSNVLVGASGHVKLADFGLSTSTLRRKACGTLPYIAPEILVPDYQGTSAATKAVDLWSVGVTLFEMTMGELPFDSTSTSAGQLLSTILDSPLYVNPEAAKSVPADDDDGDDGGDDDNGDANDDDDAPSLGRPPRFLRACPSPCALPHWTLGALERAPTLCSCAPLAGPLCSPRSRSSSSI